MFSTKGLFDQIACPDKQNCKRVQCVFSHQLDTPALAPLHIPVEDRKQNSSTESGPSSSIPSKRPLVSARIEIDSVIAPASEPPRKVQRLASSRPSVTQGPSSESGAPTLKVIPAQSQVPVPVRQTMLKTLYDYFSTLYKEILPSNPEISADHALRQETEIYNKSTKQSYRNAVIQCAASLKRRPVPNSINHPSVGTEGDIQERKELADSIKAFKLTREHLEPLLLSNEDMEKWGYLTNIPDGQGGDRPFEQGLATCDRCNQKFMVKKETEDPYECIFHWGRIQTIKVTGERMRVYRCCSQAVADGGGCTKGRHVFYGTSPDDLHARHPFSHLRPPNPGSLTQLEFSALDCEMIYTTGGMRVARVSCVDGEGIPVFDELVKMDDGVDVIDYNTRFSGITAEGHAMALLPLAAIRLALEEILSSETILIGHALENDLRTLRIIHSRCVDTAVLFSRNGFRRSLRDLVRENLGSLIQTGDGTVGHSSVEDSVATLDLLKWHVKHKSVKVNERT